MVSQNSQNGIPFFHFYFTNIMTTEQQNTNQIEVNLDIIKKAKVQFAMPCYGGQLTEQTFTSFIKWTNTARQLGLDWSIETMVNESLISRARNTLTAKFLASDSTHLFFVDADIGFEPWHVLVLINHDVDLIGGLYPMKTMPIKWVVNGLENAQVSETGLLEVTKTGTGFMLIKREVFEKCNNHPSVVSYKNDTGLDPHYDQFLKTYFDCSVRENRYYSEDWQFCENYRDLGGKVFVDTRVLLTHTGTYTFSQPNQDRINSELETLWLNKLKQNGVQLIDSAGNPIQI